MYGAFKGTSISSPLFSKRQVLLLSFFILDFVRRYSFSAVPLFLSPLIFFLQLTFSFAAHSNFFLVFFFFFSLPTFFILTFGRLENKKTP